MPNNPEVSARIAGYVDHDLRRRAEEIGKVKRRMTMSRVIEECLEIGLPVIEKRVGLFGKVKHSRNGRTNGH